MMKKLVALILAVVMIMAMGSVAFAADENVYTGTSKTTHGTDTITLNKTIVIFNPDDNTSVREPDITFSYVVSPYGSGSDGDKLTSTVTDGSTTVTVYKGVTGGVTAPADIQYSHDNAVPATKKGYQDQKNTSIGVTPTAFPHAGVYRYQIVESSNPADVTTVGLENHTANYSNTRYMDVYIKNGTSGLELQGAVIFKTTAKDTSSPANNATDAITTTTEKTTGFEPGKNDTSSTEKEDYKSDDTVDRYFTYNLKVGKTTKGNLADLNHDFPFEIVLTGNLSHAVTADYTASGATYDGTAPTTFSVSSTAYTLKPKMSNGDYIEVKGLPTGTSVTVKETQDTTDTYVASWDTTEGTTTSSVTITSSNDPTTNLSLPKDGTVSSSPVAVDGGSSYVKTVLGYTNNMTEISETGVVMRVAPYVLILAAGMTLLLISRRRKAEEE